MCTSWMGRALMFSLFIKERPKGAPAKLAVHGQRMTGTGQPLVVDYQPLALLKSEC